MREFQVEFLERLERTRTSVSYRFSFPEDFSFTAGQYMLVDLGSKLVHPLSLSECPEETGYIEFTKRMTGSPYCRRLQSLQKGEPVSIKGPAGKFSLEPSSGVTIVMIAGGIGITPMRSILKSLACRKENPYKIILIYGNVNTKDIAFRDELETMKLSDYHLVHVLEDTVSMPEAYQGYISADILSREVPGERDAIYMVSGPPVMVNSIKKILGEIGVSRDQVKTDLFIGYD